MSVYPEVSSAMLLESEMRRVYIGAYGFEDRALGWTNLQTNRENILSEAVIINYKNAKGDNNVSGLKTNLTRLGANITEVDYDVYEPYTIENNLEIMFRNLSRRSDEIIIDISAMTKLLILICLCHLRNFTGTLRIVYSEAEEYAPTLAEYGESKVEMSQLAKFPSRGIQSLIRTKCLSSIRMQGQPVLMIAFASFNEQLIRHMLGTISPYKLLIINGKPLRQGLQWRQQATQEIHDRILAEYALDNPMDEQGHLTRIASTLDYRDTITIINEIYGCHGNSERIICGATGSKMQTVGLYFCKIEHPDIHIEYPTPDSYFVRGMSIGVKAVHEIIVDRFADLIESVASQQDPEVVALADLVASFK